MHSKQKESHQWCAHSHMWNQPTNCCRQMTWVFRVSITRSEWETTKMSKPVFWAYIETGIFCRHLTTLISSRLRWISLSFETRSTVSSTCSQATSFWMLTWFLPTTRSTTCQPPQCSPRDRYSNHTFGNDLGNWNWRHCYQICLARNLPRAAVRCASERFETEARAHTGQWNWN